MSNNQDQEQLTNTMKKKIIMLQYNQMQGVKKGKKMKWSINNHSISFEGDHQKGRETSRDYLIGLVNPKTNQIQWVQSIMMEVRAKLPDQKQSLATPQTWDIGYKKKLVQQFGTSKSKRKINQMLSNSIN